MEGNNQKFVFKIIYGEDMRRISISNDQTFNQFYLTLTTLFQVDNLQLSWQDDEEDLLALKNDQDLKDCLRFYVENGLKSIKIVAKLPQQQTQPPQQQQPTMKSVEESFPSMKINDSSNNNSDSTSTSPLPSHCQRFGPGYGYGHGHHRRHHHLHHLHVQSHPHPHHLGNFHHPHAHHFGHPHFHHNPHFHHQTFPFPPHHDTAANDDDMISFESKKDFKEWKKGWKKEWKKEFGKHGCHWKNQHGFENLEAGNEAQSEGWEKFGKCRRRGMKLARLERLKNTPGFDEAEFQTKLEALENLNLKTGLLAQILIAKSMVRSKANNHFN